MRLNKPRTRGIVFEAKVASDDIATRLKLRVGWDDSSSGIFAKRERQHSTSAKKALTPISSDITVHTMPYPEPDYIQKPVYFAGGPPGPGGETRAQRHADQTASGGFEPIPCAPKPQPGTAIGQFRPPKFLPYVCNGTTYNFKFQIITGAPLATPIWPSPTAPALHLSGTSFVTYLGVYLPSGGTGPGGPPGASIDALNITTGQLINGNAQGNFVTVDDEPGNVADASLTNSGNVYGWVPTNTTDAKITADGTLGISGPGFCGWLDLLNPPANGILPSANDLSFTAHKNHSYYRLACYFDYPSVPKVGPGIWRPTIIIGIDGSITVIHGVGGPPVTIKDGSIADSGEID